MSTHDQTRYFKSNTDTIILRLTPDKSVEKLSRGEWIPAIAIRGRDIDKGLKYGAFIETDATGDPLVKLTERLIRAAMTSKRGLKKDQLAMLGESWPPQRGWIQRSIGKLMTAEKYERFVALGRDSGKAIEHTVTTEDDEDQWGRELMKPVNDRLEADARKIASLEATVAAQAAALRSLVAAKDLKDACGDTAEYRARKTQAWIEARAALSPDAGKALLEELERLRAEKAHWQDGRRQGREEALQILIEYGAEDFEDFIGSEPSGEDYMAVWKYEDLRKLFDADERHSLVDRLGASFWELQGYKDGYTAAPGWMSPEDAGVLRGRVESLEAQQSIWEEDLKDIYRLTNDVCHDPETGAEAVAHLVDDRDALLERLEVGFGIAREMEAVDFGDECPSGQWDMMCEQLCQWHATLDIVATRDLTSTPAQPGRECGVSLIAKERERQQSVEGWTPEHDDCHSNAELRDAAISYAYRCYTPRGPIPTHWQWDRSWWKPSHDPIRNLVKAGALIAAEIDRLNRKNGNTGRVDGGRKDER